MQSLSAGALRDRVRFDMRSGGTDAYGNPATGWTLRGYLWASVRELIGRSAEEAGIPSNRHGARIAVRNRGIAKQVEVTDRVTFRGKTASIKSVIQRDATGEILDLLVEIEGVTG